jgi:hypothetical protein
MGELTQREKFLKEERLLMDLIQSYQSEIDSYSEDLAVARRLLAALDNGSDINAWGSYIAYTSKGEN